MVSIPGTAWADLGVGVTANALELPHALRPGNSYQLPTLTVVNTGSQAASYHLRIERLTKKNTATTIPPAWITFSDPAFGLAPKDRASVVLRVSVPRSAQSGTYTSDVIATGTLPNAQSQAKAGAAAAAAINFTVTRTAAVNGSSIPGYAWLILVGSLIVVLLALGIWRSGLRVRVERRDT
jgi:cobalamin biosynthesis Mg chelatase CobN